MAVPMLPVEPQPPAFSRPPEKPAVTNTAPSGHRRNRCTPGTSRPCSEMTHRRRSPVAVSQGNAAPVQRGNVSFRPSHQCGPLRRGLRHRAERTVRGQQSRSVGNSRRRPKLAALVDHGKNRRADHRRSGRQGQSASRRDLWHQDRPCQRRRTEQRPAVAGRCPRSARGRRSDAARGEDVRAVAGPESEGHDDLAPGKPTTLTITWPPTRLRWNGRRRPTGPGTRSWAWKAAPPRLVQTRRCATKRIANTGQYAWRLPPNFPTHRVYIRITAHDTAGNIGEVRSPHPILVDMNKPVPKVHGIIGAGRNWSIIDRGRDGNIDAQEKFRERVEPRN